MENLTLYNLVRGVPDAAKREISAGRLRGKTDINPMWRIKILTEQFGACGFGWRYEIISEQIVDGAAGEKVAFVRINLYIKMDGEWSAAIPGTGGSSFIAKEKNGLYTSDECYKMALTDAISVACKALGIGADVYWGADATKYSGNTSQQAIICKKCKKTIKPTKNKAGIQFTPEQIAKSTGGLCLQCHAALKAGATA